MSDRFFGLYSRSLPRTDFLTKPDLFLSSRAVSALSRFETSGQPYDGCISYVPAGARLFRCGGNGRRQGGSTGRGGSQLVNAQANEYRSCIQPGRLRIPADAGPCARQNTVGGIVDASVMHALPFPGRHRRRYCVQCRSLCPRRQFSACSAGAQRFHSMLANCDLIPFVGVDVGTARFLC